MKISEYVENLMTKWDDLKKLDTQLVMKKGEFDKDIQELVKHLGFKEEQKEVNLVELISAALKNHYKDTENK